MEYFAQQAINAIQLGAIYALIALGYSLVYGVLTMINFAHGDLFMVGAFFCLIIASLFPLPFVVILVLVMLSTGFLGALIERVAYRPLRSAPRVSAIITALGCGLVIENLVSSLSPYAKPMPALFSVTGYNLGGLSISSLQILIIGVSILLMVGLDFFIRRTSFGMAMRAISFDSRTVPLLGIPLNKVISVTFLIGAGLGGAAGMLYGLAYPVIAASMGVLVGWKAFIAAVVGGIGSIRGAVVGGFILGLVEVMTVAVLPSTYRDLIAYSLLLVILIFKPYGLLGKAPNQKV
ncbi:branched-chain amino acid ABC transporter permease [Spartobacteria bacterium LR76]|nr:branched-chain amino acid ABC transporter permease [Spartobacteria bacterium LR76]